MLQVIHALLDVEQAASLLLPVARRRGVLRLSVSELFNLSRFRRYRRSLRILAQQASLRPRSLLTDAVVHRAR